MWNDNDALFPWASVAVHAYSVRGKATPGVPLTLNWESPVVASCTPEGRAGLSVYTGVPLPPLACGSTSGSMLWFCTQDWSSIASENDIGEGIIGTGPSLPCPGGGAGGITTSPVTLM